MDRGIRRRTFLAAAGAAACAGVAPGPARASARALGPAASSSPLRPREARYYDKLENLRVRCQLCPRKCEVADQERGYCGVRENHGGVYMTLVHGRACAAHVDPIEKKPLFHFLPGTLAFSLATAGCNVECKFCQNWDISQFRPEDLPDLDLPPERVARRGLSLGCRTLAYTYSEPVVFYEYMADCAEAGRAAGLHSVMISNGYIQEKPLRALLPRLSAVKIDLKAFTERFYKETCSGELKPVLETLVRLREGGIWFEIVVLVVPTLNDSPAEFRAMCRWVASELGPDVPIHFSRFHPAYKLKNLPVTPVATLERARSAALEAGLHFAYVGNVPGHPGENTYCPGCGRVLIRRVGFSVLENALRRGRCPDCHRALPGVFS